MTVIVRNITIDTSGNETFEEVYKSIKKVITKKEILQAEKLDNYLKQKMDQIFKDLNSRGLISGKQGDLERWYNLGKNLDFVDDSSVVPPEDRFQDQYIWEALWQHAPLGVRPGEPNSRTGTKRDHFRECYLLAKIPYEIVKGVGSWSDWVNFLETPAVMDDLRIILWVGNELQGVDRQGLRNFTKGLRRKFKKRITSVLSEEELHNELKIIGEMANNL